MSKPVSPTSLIPDRRQTACELTSSMGASAAVFNLGSAAVCRSGSRGVYLRRPDNTFPAKHHGPDLSRSGKCLLIPRYVVRSSCYECSVLAITFWNTEACILFLSQPEASDRRSRWSDSRNHTVTDQFWSFVVWLYAWTRAIYRPRANLFTDCQSLELGRGTSMGYTYLVSACLDCSLVTRRPVWLVETRGGDWCSASLQTTWLMFIPASTLF